MTDNWYDNKDIYEMLQEVKSDAEILANYQSGKPVGFDSYTTYYEPFDGLYDWQVVGVWNTIY